MKEKHREGFSMIEAVGVDIVKIERIKKLLIKERFLEKCFSEKEREQINSCHALCRRAEMAAGTFAAKEAYLKAVGAKMEGFDLTDIQVLREETGRPYIVPAKVHESFTFHLSISHEKEYAVAFVVMQRRQEI